MARTLACMNRMASSVTRMDSLVRTLVSPSCLQMYPNQNNFVFFLNSPRRLLRHFFRLNNLLTTKPHFEGN